jgi:hypothetical protein
LAARVAVGLWACLPMMVLRIDGGVTGATLTLSAVAGQFAHRRGWETINPGVEKGRRRPFAFATKCLLVQPKMKVRKISHTGAPRPSALVKF